MGPQYVVRSPIITAVSPAGGGGGAGVAGRVGASDFYPSGGGDLPAGSSWSQTFTVDEADWKLGPDAFWVSPDFVIPQSGIYLLVASPNEGTDSPLPTTGYFLMAVAVNGAVVASAPIDWRNINSFGYIWMPTAMYPTQMSAGDTVTIRYQNNTDAPQVPGGYVVWITAVRLGDPVCFDTLQRTVASGWGTATSGAVWSGSGAGTSVAPGDGQMACDAIGGSAVLFQFAEFIPIAVMDCRFTGSLAIDYVPTDPGTVLGELLDLSFDTGHVEIDYATPTTVDVIVGDSAGRHLISGVALDPTQPFVIRFYSDATDLKVKVWQASGAEPGTWTFEGTSGGDPNASLTVTTEANPTGPVSVATVTLHASLICFA